MMFLGTCSISLHTSIYILIFSSSPNEHVEHVKKLINRLLENHLYVKPEKCEFHVTQVEFLGFITMPGHIQMDH